MPRKFGIEIEFAGDPLAALAKLREAGLADSSSIHSYSGHSQTKWIMKHDASVRGGGELVGPPLDWDDPAQRGQIRTAVQCLVDAGCRTTPSAGIHVHIDATDLSAKQVAGVARTFTKYEDQIYRIACSGWQTMRHDGFANSGCTGWCKPIPRTGQGRGPGVEQLAKAKTREQLGRAWYGSTSNMNYAGHGDSTRYHGLNIHSYFYRGTIEFRIFNSSMNAKRIEAYVCLSMAIVQDGRDGKMRSINRVFRLGDMKLGILPEKKALHHFCQFLRWENETSPISKEDLALITYCWKNSVPIAAPAGHNPGRMEAS